MGLGLGAAGDGEGAGDGEPWQKQVPSRVTQALHGPPGSRPGAGWGEALCFSSATPPWLNPPNPMWNRAPALTSISR